MKTQRGQSGIKKTKSSLGKSTVVLLNRWVKLTV